MRGEAVDPNYKRFIKGLNLTKYKLFHIMNQLKIKN